MVALWILFLCLHLFYIVNASGLPDNHQTIWAEISSNTTFCCNLTFKESEALQLRVNDQRICSSVKRPGKDIRRYISPSAKAWNINETVKDDICLTKTNNNPDEIENPPQIICEKSADEGLGETLEKKSIILKFYEQAKIVKFPKSLKFREGSNQVIECSATGFPDLYVVWRLKNGSILKHSHQPNSSVSRSNIRLINLPLELLNIRSDQHGDVYVCEAGINSAVNQNPVIKELMLEVNLYPKIHMTDNVIYTDIGVEERFNILVTGYPTPTLTCNDLPVSDPHMLSNKPQGGTWAYRVVLNQITSQHLHEYLCKANNSLGSVNQKLEVTVSPAPPKILSPNLTEFADYYLLHWTTNSRAPLKNVTVTISETSTNTESNTGSSIVPRSPILHERVFNLEDDKIDTTSTVIQHIQSDSNNSKQIWHHLTNLSSDTRHDISLNVCNTYACSKSSTLRSRSGGSPSRFTIKTPEFDGSNKINPSLLQRSPKDLLSLDAHETKSPRNGNSANLKPYQTWIILFIVTLLLRSILI
ncbi:unnamed protein product [Schistosoma rodhaini]|uniref:Ig-like domain-containing protein n=1 Tax=Schistosoma rodhaini TaxID=6188 RepID=A0AA85GGC7_9TREM|nr:unnamed protein product [Schistosoma rodhaini]